VEVHLRHSGVLLQSNFLMMLLLLPQYVVVEILLEHGADIEAKTRNGETALGAYYRHNHCF